MTKSQEKNQIAKLKCILLNIVGLRPTNFSSKLAGPIFLELYRLYYIISVERLKTYSYVVQQ